MGVPVVGTDYFQQAAGELLASAGPAGASAIECTGVLVAEPPVTQDDLAVCVEVAGQVIGFLPVERDDLRRYVHHSGSVPAVVRIERADSRSVTSPSSHAVVLDVAGFGPQTPPAHVARTLAGAGGQAPPAEEAESSVWVDIFIVLMCLAALVKVIIEGLDSLFTFAFVLFVLIATVRAVRNRFYRARRLRSGGSPVPGSQVER